MLSLIVIWLVTTVSFVILTKLPTGIESDSLAKSAQAALVFGLLNGLTSWFLRNGILNFLTLGLLFLVGNTILFALAALFVKGFRLRWGIVSALIGAVGVTILNSIILRVLSLAG